MPAFNVKRGGSYQAPAIFCKRNGVYGAVVGAFVKKSGTYYRIDGGGGSLPGISDPTFNAPLQTTLVTNAATDGTITFTRATAAWDFDDQGYLRDYPSGCARFTGARALYNRIPQSENLSTGWTRRGSCTVTGSKTDPNGGSTAYQIDNIGVAGVDDIYYSVTNTFLVPGTPLYIGFWIKKVSSSGTINIINSNGNGFGRWDINLATLPSTWVYVDHTSPYISLVAPFIASSSNGIGLQITQVTTGPYSIQLWGVQDYRFSHVNPTLASSTEYISSGVLSAPFHGAAANGVKFFPNNASGNRISDSTMKGVLIEGARTNNLKYCRDLTKGSVSNSVVWNIATTGSELVTNGTFTTDTSGWTFGNATGAVVSNQLVVTATAASPATLTSVTTVIGQAYVVTLDFIADTSTANIFLYVGTNSYGSQLLNQAIGSTAGNSIRGNFIATTTTTYISIIGSSLYAAGETFTIDNVSCKQATVKAVLNATGICNQENACTTLTATANNATILQQFTLASAARSFSAYVKRKTGTGTISITRDGGSNWTDITSQINSSTFTRVSILNTSVTNPNCGFKFGTSGDEIIVDCCQDEAGVNVSTPIITTSATVTRNADVLTYPVANLHATKNTVYHEAIPYDTIADFDRRSLDLTGTTNNRAMCLYKDKYVLYGTGSGTVGTGTVSYTLGTLIKNIIRWENGNPGSAFFNSVKCADTASNVSVTPTKIEPGMGSAATGVFCGNIKNVRIWPNTALTDAQCIQLTS